MRTEQKQKGTHEKNNNENAMKAPNIRLFARDSRDFIDPIFSTSTESHSSVKDIARPSTTSIYSICLNLISANYNCGIEIFQNL